MYSFTPGEMIIWTWQLPDGSVKMVKAEVVTYGGNGLKIKLHQDVIGEKDLILASENDIHGGIWPEDVQKIE